LAIEKRLNNDAAPAPASAPTEVLTESNGYNKREREDINNTSNSSIDSDFQTQPAIVEKKPKYQNVDDMEDFSIPSAPCTAPSSSSKSESPRRNLPPNLIGKEPLTYKSSLDKFRLENYDKKAYMPRLKTPNPYQSKGKENSANVKYDTFNEIPRIFVGSRTYSII
jgi:hypothetical protein